MRTLTYCNNWSSILGSPNKVMPEARARRLHEQKKLFEIVVAEDGVEKYVITASLDTSCYLVYFLDDRKRKARVHVFGDAGDGRLFLKGIDDRHYHQDDRRSKFDVIALYFDRDGSVWTPYADATGWKRRDLYKGLDVTDHYEPWPEFGQYDSLLRRKRSIPPGLGVEAWE